MSSRRYNIAHVLHTSKVMGGTEHATLRIAAAIRGRGFDSYAFCPREDEMPVRDQFEDAGIPCVIYEAVEPSYRHPKNFLRSSFRLASEYRRHNIDLVHCSDLLAASYAAFAGRLAGAPVLSHVRGIFSELSRRDQSFLLAVNRFAFVSNDTWNRFGYKVSKRRGTVVYDGIELNSGKSRTSAAAIRHRYGIPESTKIVGMVARVTAAKDYSTLASAASRVLAVCRDVCFMIVGDHSGHKSNRQHYLYVLQLLSDAGLDSKFIFTGHQLEVAPFLEAMDIFVLCTHSEGLPLVILEAMAMGKPVIATAVGGIPEIVNNNQTGLLHDHEDAETLASQILALLRDEQLAERIGMAGRSEVGRKWTGEQFAANIVRLYKDMLGAKDPGGVPAFGEGGVFSKQVK